MKPASKLVVCVGAVLGGIITLAVAFAQKSASPYPKEITHWIETAPPQNDDWRGANHSRYEWLVTRKNGKVTVVPDTLANRDTVTLPFDFVPQTVGQPPVTKPGAARLGKSGAAHVPGGWLLASDFGEWGGDIYWLSENGKRQHKIYGENVGSFVQNAHGDLFALTGLSHMGLSTGGVLRLIPVGTKGDKSVHDMTNAAAPWKVKVLADLQEKAYVAVAEKDGSLLVVTRDRLVRVSPDGTVRNLVEKAFWGGLYPNSLVSGDAGRLYIGMRHGVARIALSHDGAAATVRWLVPDKTFLHPRSDSPGVVGDATSVGR